VRDWKAVLKRVYAILLRILRKKLSAGVF